MNSSGNYLPSSPIIRCGFVVYLEKDFEECYSRLAAQENRPIVQSRTKEELRHMYEDRIPLYRRYAAFSIRNHGTVEDAVNQIWNLISPLPPQLP